MGYKELAKAIKGNENIEKIGAIVGEVVQGGADYKISIIDNMFYLNNSNSKLCNSLKDRIEEIEIEINGNKNIGKIEYKNVLITGDKVLVIANESNQHFFIVDKL